LGDSPKEDFPMPDKVVVVPVDLDPSNECVRVVPMAFVKGTEPAACGARRQSVPPVGVPGAPPATTPRRTRTAARPPGPPAAAPPRRPPSRAGPDEQHAAGELGRWIAGRGCQRARPAPRAAAADPAPGGRLAAAPARRRAHTPGDGNAGPLTPQASA